VLDVACDLDVDPEDDRGEHQALGRAVHGPLRAGDPAEDLDAVAGGERLERGEHAQAERRQDEVLR
jgi:hypothetical protein